MRKGVKGVKWFQCPLPMERALIEFYTCSHLHLFSFKTPISESSIRGEGAVMSEECAADCASHYVVDAKWCRTT